MVAPPTDAWLEANQRGLTAAVDRVRVLLESYVAQTRGQGGGERHTGVACEIVHTLPAARTLETLCAAFGLSPFERDLLLCCAGMEFDGRFARLCAAAHGDPQCAYPTFSLALAALPEAHWSALTPGRPLRCWRLIEVGPGNALALSPLRIDERIAHFLAGIQQLDERLASIADPIAAAADLVPSHRALASRIVSLWSTSPDGNRVPLVQLCGSDIDDKRAIAAAACGALGRQLYAVGAEAIPSSRDDFAALVRLWSREAVLSDVAIMLVCDAADPADLARVSAVTRLSERLTMPVILSSREPWRLERAAWTIDVGKPAHHEQRALWRQELGALSFDLDGQVDRLVAQFSLSGPAIHTATRRVAGGGLSGDGLAASLWDGCREQARARLDDLAQRIEPAAGWEDLVLPGPQRQMLREIAAQVQQRATVYEHWGFATKGLRGLGITALFAGPSGTGKTMAAEVLANELRLDLYRVDLSSVVSKYIGETEKNLRRVFDAADAGGAILLFDEADALFGHRSEVKDSHDRYANIEVSYLLQRMEAYRGLAVLTTNLRKALDPAFLRRIRFVVHFPFPDTEQRTEIWRRIFPPTAPTEGLDVGQLARLSLAGGNIRNIALNAAFRAAEERAAIRMTHLAAAARAEYAKLEKPLTEAEMSGWHDQPP